MGTLSNWHLDTGERDEENRVTQTPVLERNSSTLFLLAGGAGS
jgi:hypothetical protein